MPDTPSTPPPARGISLQAAPQLADYRYQHSVQDLYNRTRLGPLFCGIGACITALAGGYFSSQPVFTWGIVAAFLILLALRWHDALPNAQAPAQQMRRWWTRQWSLLHLTALFWCGFLAVVGTLEQSASTAFMAVALVTMAYATASCESLALNRAMAWGVISLMQLPAIAWLATQNADLRGLLWVMLAYWVYQMLHVHRRAREYDAQIALEHNLMVSRAEIERLSREDVLTGLANRREYESAFNLHWNFASRSRGKLSLIVIDLDYFKRINDTHGHLAGDACLKHVAHLLLQRLPRVRDTVARIGGEEFAVVLPDTPQDVALHLAQDFCTTLANTPFEFEGHLLTITASIGVGEVLWVPDLSPSMSFKRVDGACYRAKAQGRNRVVQA
jgi:diguanylate cyclase